MGKRVTEKVTGRMDALLDRAWSYESRAGWEADGLNTKFAGTVQRGKRFYDLYMDTAGNCWYKVRVLTDCGIVPEHEAVFGHPEKGRQRREW